LTEGAAMWAASIAAAKGGARPPHPNALKFT
jgi:hypothetical protein